MNKRFLILLLWNKPIQGKINPPFENIRKESGTRSVLILHRAHMDEMGVTGQ